jgi:uncharacterized protein YneF (UPF0154 family)
MYALLCLNGGLRGPTNVIFSSLLFSSLLLSCLILCYVMFCYVMQVLLCLNGGLRGPFHVVRHQVISLLRDNPVVKYAIELSLTP